ncbi:MAG: metallopeptidase TldD-related protein [archaeon]
MNKEELFEYCNKLSKNNSIEFIYRENVIDTCSIKQFELNTIKNNSSSALLIRALENYQFGNCVITNITKENIANGINQAKKIAKLKNNIKIKDFGSSKISNAKIKFDKTLKEININNLFLEVKENLTKDKYIKSYEGGISKAEKYQFYINPHVNDISDLSYLTIGININTFDKTQSSGGYGEIFSKAKDIDISNVFNTAKINANNLINPLSGKKDNYTLIFIPEVLQSIVESLILPATVGEDIEKKESYLCESINKSVFSKNLTISEEPTLDYFLGSSLIDDEGFSTSKKVIIENGVFKKAIYDQLNATIYNKAVTGNGFRGSLFSDIACDHTNTIQNAGSQKIEDIISQTKKGLLVYGVMGLHTSNLTNGNFSLTINQAVLIENGKLKNSITNLNFTGNCKEAFKDMIFSKEQRFFGDSTYSFGIIDNVKLV